MVHMYYKFHLHASYTEQVMKVKKYIGLRLFGCHGDDAVHIYSEFHLH